MSALIDTGSPMSLIPIAIAESIGVDIEAAIAQGGTEIRTPFLPVGDEPTNAAPLVAYPVIVDLAFVRSPSEHPPGVLSLLNVRVFVAEFEGLPILGQFDTLQRLRFDQRNFEPHLDCGLSEAT